MQLPYECPVCHKRFWTSGEAFSCCEGTAAHRAWLETINRRAREAGWAPTMKERWKIRKEKAKRYECPVCHKRFWTSEEAFQCCEGTAAHQAWLETINRRAREAGWTPTAKEQKQLQQRGVGDKPIESTMQMHDCPKCHGKPGNYFCPICEGMGKTFL